MGNMHVDRYQNELYLDPTEKGAIGVRKRQYYQTVFLRFLVSVIQTIGGNAP
jgi:hypothetical protein